MPRRVPVPPLISGDPKDPRKETIMTTLLISWSTSRARDTYGYNIVRLDDSDTHKRYRAMGGGYDMVGTVFGEWLADRYGQRLLEIADEAGDTVRPGRDGRQHNRDGWYGMTAWLNDGGAGLRVTLDGACGIESMRRLAQRIGVETKWLGDRRGQTIGFEIDDRRAVSS